MSPWRPLAWSLLFGLSVSGAFTYLSASSKTDADDESTGKKYETKVDTPMIGDYTTFSGLQPVVIEGVGLSSV